MKERIQELRLWLNLSQNEFASAIGISASALSSLINGHNNPSLKLVTSIKKAYPQVSTDWLLLGTGSMLESDGKGDSPATHQPTQTLAQPSVSQPVQGVLFDTPRDTVAEKIANPPTPTPQSRFQRPLVKDVSVAKNSDKPQRCIKQVIIIYDDGTSQTINSNT